MPVPEAPWDSISMDFITCLPKTKAGFDTLLVVVCRLTKYVIVVPTILTIDGADVARLCVDHVFSKHGFPSSIVSDRDVRFTADFWRALHMMLGTKLLMSSAFHPQTDGQTERMNRTLEETLRHFVAYKQDDWDSHIQMAAFAINNARNESIKNTPFFLNKGLHPRMPSGISSLPLDQARPCSAIKFAAGMQESLAQAKKFMYNAQQRQKAYADKSRQEARFAVGDMVFLATKNLKLKNNDRTRARQKLLPRFIGPYKVLKLVGPAAVKLDLPSSTRVHDVFHVSLIKLFKPPTLESGQIIMHSNPPPLDWLEKAPMFVVDKLVGHRVASQGGRKWVEYKVRWAGYDESQDTFEPRESLLQTICDTVDAYDAIHASTANPVPSFETSVNHRPKRIRKKRGV